MNKTRKSNHLFFRFMSIRLTGSILMDVLGLKLFRTHQCSQLKGIKILQQKPRSEVIATKKRSQKRNLAKYERSTHRLQPPQDLCLYGLWTESFPLHLCLSKEVFPGCGLPRTIDHRLYGFQIIHNRLQIIDYRLGYRLQIIIINDRLQIVDYRLETINYRLYIINCRLYIIYV